MISADTNIFIHARNSESSHHQQARDFLNAHVRNDRFVVCGPVLVEIYMQLRNPALFSKPYSGAEAADFCESLAEHKYWKFVDYKQDIMPAIWEYARQTKRGFRHIIDARIALTLQHYGVKEFATVNLKDFEGFGFERVWNPLQEG